MNGPLSPLGERVRVRGILITHLYLFTQRF